MDIRIIPPEEMIEGSVALPLSKSMSNRALVMNALTPGAAPLTEVADCDDTDAMVAALQQYRKSAGGQLQVNVGPAGTAMRFLTAYFAAEPGAEVVLDGNERMRKRPIGALVDALRLCGADIAYEGEEGYPPLRIRGKRLHGAEVEMPASISSQFVSALLMVAPTMDTPLTLRLKGEIASLPYLTMTIAMMQRRGIKIERMGNLVSVEPGHYLSLPDAGIERDWSAASYFYEIAAISAGWITLDGLTVPSLQGDSALVEIYDRLGIITNFEDGNAELVPSPEVHSRLDLDLADNPDIAQTLAVTCCMIGIPFRFTGLQSLKIKETDRLAALVAELAKLSFVAEIEKDSILSWEGQRMPVASIEPIATYADHRMAMAFAPVALFVPGLIIKDAEVVSKSYPQYWDDLRHLGFTIEEI